ncbi:hypothetical protein FRB94_014251 [Tulasnella sp. JGI-2019a]|nr:hypothetical protein FRB93_005400 [Tulasnella sp. JGI-2019a]KAG9014158.1 hypothetical protein FRB94_014251 [Tulasnella sp. JGI-2019a]
MLTMTVASMTPAVEQVDVETHKAAFAQGTLITLSSSSLPPAKRVSGAAKTPPTAPPTAIPQGVSRSSPPSTAANREFPASRTNTLCLYEHE